MGWRPDRCDRTPALGHPGYDPHQMGHQWEVYQARWPATCRWAHALPTTPAG